MVSKFVWYLVVLCNCDILRSIVSAGEEMTPSNKHVFQKWTTHTRGLGSSQITDRDNKVKRGIILVDEDFNVPAKPGVQHGWGESELEPDGIFITKKDKESILPGDGSGDEAESLKRTFETTIKSERIQTTNKAAITISVREEGSGDDAYSTPSLEKTEMPIEEPIPHICMNFTCNSEDLEINNKYEGLIAAGTNLTISCIIRNSSDNDMLFWYRSNGSAYMLQTFTKHYELHFHMPDVNLVHSGSYVCVKWINRHFCCHKELHVAVYEVPAYKYHLLIIILITAACLLGCIFLAVWRSLTLKRYTKQFVKAHSTQKPLLI